MTDYLRTRIAAAVAIAIWAELLKQREDEREVDMMAVADAVIRELNRDYILVPKGRTIARIRSAEKLGLTGDGA